MTTSNPPTAVEALRLAAEDARSLLHQVALSRSKIGPLATHAQAMAFRLADALQALQLHGGGESRSSLPPIALHGKDVPRTAAWLLEWPGDNNMPTRYWHPKSGWMLDPHNGCWFARKADAEGYRAQIKATGVRSILTSTEHIFGLNLGTVQQASMDGSELKAEAHPILQGPTRKEVREAVNVGISDWIRSGEPANSRDHIVDSILALLNPTSPWRDMRDAPRDGTEIVFINKFAHCSDVVHWRDEYFKHGLRHDGRFENRAAQSTGMNDDVAWLFWTRSPLPALPGGGE